MEELVLLKKYILDAPASQQDHQQALNWLNSILEQYKEQIRQLQEQSSKTDK